MYEKIDEGKIEYQFKWIEQTIHYYIDLPGVLDPDLDVEIVETQIIIRAQRTLPDSKLLSCQIPLQAPISGENIRICFEYGVLEIILPDTGDLNE
jgi:HSP20 family molecular chaperone IbpA